MKKWYSIGLVLLVIALMGMMVAACGSSTTTTTTSPATTAAATTAPSTSASPTGDASKLGIYFKDMGNNVVYITDVPEAGMAFPVTTSGDFASKIWATDASGAKVAAFTTEDGNVDYSSVVGKAVKIHVAAPTGGKGVYKIPK